MLSTFFPNVWFKYFLLCSNFTLLLLIMPFSASANITTGILAAQLFVDSYIPIIAPPFDFFPLGSAYQSVVLSVKCKVYIKGYGIYHPSFAFVQKWYKICMSKAFLPLLQLLEQQTQSGIWKSSCVPSASYIIFLIKVLQWDPAAILLMTHATKYIPAHNTIGSTDITEVKPRCYLSDCEWLESITRGQSSVVSLLVSRI